MTTEITGRNIGRKCSCPLVLCQALISAVARERVPVKFPIPISQGNSRRRVTPSVFTGTLPRPLSLGAKAYAGLLLQMSEVVTQRDHPTRLE